MRQSLLLLLFAICVFSCSAPKAEPSINGIWNSLGSGWVMQIQDSSSYTLYDTTSNFCILNRDAALEEILPELQLQNDTLRWKKGVITYHFTQEEQTTAPCNDLAPRQDEHDPLYNFEVFAETVYENYAFMELNAVNWDSLYVHHKAKLAATPTNAQLYLELEALMEGLNDNHGYLEADDTTYAALEALEEAALAAEEEMEVVEEIGDFQIAQQVAQHHLIEDMTKDSWLVHWGRLEDSIGYIQVKSMWLYADLDLSQELVEQVGYVDAYVQTFHQLYEGDYIAKEVDGIRKTMEKVMADLSGMKAVVIDVRFNGGGQDAVSFEILRWFNPAKRAIALQQLRDGNGFSPKNILSLEGKDAAFNKPVYVLTSPQTGSAAEAFAIATLAMPQVQRIGGPTSGALSTALEKKLPNGWSYALSNEIYMDLEGNVYENKGVPVDYALPYPEDRQTFFRAVANNLAKDKQDILTAITTLERQ